VETFSELEWSIVEWSVVKCSESLSNRVSNTIRRNIAHMKFAAFMAFSFIIFLHGRLFLFYHCIWFYVLYNFVFNSQSYVFLLLCLCIPIVMYALFCMFCFHRINWHSSATLTEVFRAFSSVVKPGYMSQRRGTVRTLPNQLTVLFFVLFVCKCVLYYCYRVSSKLQLTNTSYIISYQIIYHISYHIISNHIIYYIISCIIPYYIIS
jgi:hypothetical protein